MTGITDKNTVMRKVGCMAQLAYIRPFTYTSGKARGVKAFDVSNGTGLDFTVLESKCLDIINMRYKGINLNYFPGSGIVSPELSDMNGTEFMRCISGGMMYTCGLLNVGGACEDNGFSQVFHGRMKTTPAENTSAFCGWKDGDYTLELSGEMREAAIFNDNLVLKRSLTAKSGKNLVTVHDSVRNEGYSSQGLMLMYHINVGYPVLDVGARAIIPSAGLTPRDETSKAGAGKFAEVTEPIDDHIENVFIHETRCDSSGMTGAAVVNDKLSLGVYIKYDSRRLPRLVQWKSMQSGNYAMGIEPSTTFAQGRVFEKENGRLVDIAPGEEIIFGVEIGVLDGVGEIAEFERYVGDLKR